MNDFLLTNEVAIALRRSPAMIRKYERDGLFRPSAQKRAHGFFIGRMSRGSLRSLSQNGKQTLKNKMSMLVINEVLKRSLTKEAIVWSFSFWGTTQMTPEILGGHWPNSQRKRT